MQFIAPIVPIILVFIAINEPFSIAFSIDYRQINRTLSVNGSSSSYASNTRSRHSNGYLEQKKKFEDYQLLKELKGSCRTAGECRSWAYVCRQQQCVCALGYVPDMNNETCIGAIGKRCMYDSHCIPGAYCKGQSICTCKPEFPIESEDKWSCDDENSAMAIQHIGMTSGVLKIILANAIAYMRFVWTE